MLTANEKKTFIGSVCGQKLLVPSHEILKEFDLDIARGDKFVMRYGQLVDTCHDNRPTGYWEYDLHIWSRNK